MPSTPAAALRRAGAEPLEKHVFVGQNRPTAASQLVLELLEQLDALVDPRQLVVLHLAALHSAQSLQLSLDLFLRLLLLLGDVVLLLVFAALEGLDVAAARRDLASLDLDELHGEH